MSDAPHPRENLVPDEEADEDVDVADVSGGAIPEQMLEDPPGDVGDSVLDGPE